MADRTHVSALDNPVSSARHDEGITNQHPTDNSKDKVKHHHKHSRHQHRQQQDGPLARESVDPLERAAQVARRTSRALLRQLGLDLQPGSFLSRLRHMRGEAGEPARTVHLGSHLGPLAPEEEHALEVAVGGPEQQEQGGDKRKADKRTAGSKHRSEVPDALRYADNHVTTAKYTLLTFVPVFLFELFRNVAYFYFLIQAGLSWWSVISPFAPYGGTAALSFVVVVSAIRAAIEDVRRHKEDARVNSSAAHVLTPGGGVTDIRWANVCVGQLLVVKSGEEVPADLLCLATGLEEDVAFVRTVNLDGETNLKTRRPVLRLHQEEEEEEEEGVEGPRVAQHGVGQESAGGEVGEELVHPWSSAARRILGLRGVLQVEPPSRNLHRLAGALHLLGGAGPGSNPLESAHRPDEGGAGHPGEGSPGPVQTTPVTMNEVLLRGCLLANTPWVIGLVMYAGPDTRIQRNAARAPFKTGSLDRFLNVQITAIILFQAVLSVITGVAAWAWRENSGKLRPHLALSDPAQGNVQSRGLFILLQVLTSWILYSYLVPISLFVTLEIVKYSQALVLINRDPRLKGPIGGGDDEPHLTSDDESESEGEGEGSDAGEGQAGQQHSPTPSTLPAITGSSRPSPGAATGARTPGDDRGAGEHQVVELGGGHGAAEAEAGRPLPEVQDKTVGANRRRRAPWCPVVCWPRKWWCCGPRRMPRGQGQDLGAHSGDAPGSDAAGADAAVGGQARNSALNEDLGRVGYVFSDKTGTLTRNEMRLRQLSVLGSVVGQPPSSFRLEDAKQAPGQEMLEAWDSGLSQALGSLKSEQGGRMWEKLLREGGRGQDMAALDRRLASRQQQQQQGGPSSSPSTSQLELSQGAVSLMLCILSCHTVVLDPLPDEGTHQEQQQKEQQGDAQKRRHKGNSTHSHRHGHHRHNGSNTHDDGSHSSMDKSSSGNTQDADVSVPGAGADTSAPPADRPPNYQGPSPDEVALVHGAYLLGFKLEGRSKAKHKGGGGGGHREAPSRHKRSATSTAAAGGGGRGRQPGAPAGGGGPGPSEKASILHPVNPDQLVQGGDAGRLVDDGSDSGSSSSSVTSSAAGSDSEEDDQQEVVAGQGRNGEAANARQADGASDEDVPQGNDFLHLSVLGTPLTLAVLNVLEFSSDRKRMSTVIRTPTGRLLAFVKGADNAVLAKARPDTPQPLLRRLDQDLHTFSTQGLRTLVLGVRELDPAWYKAWDERYQAAAAALEGREEKVAAAAEELEDCLTLLGATAIEDRLQAGVQDALRALLAAGMRVWMITGDKRETAINIAVSAALFSSNVAEPKSQASGGQQQQQEAESYSPQVETSGADVGPANGPKQPQQQVVGLRLTLTSDSPQVLRPPACAEAATDIPALLESARTWLASQHDRGGGPTSGVDASMGVGAGQGGVAQAPAPSGPIEHNTPGLNSSQAPTASNKADSKSDKSKGAQAKPDVSAQDPGTHQGLGPPLELVVDGRSLGHVLPDRSLREQLAQLCALCSSVLVCRASPAQKAGIVNMMRDYTRKGAGTRACQGHNTTGGGGSNTRSRSLPASEGSKHDPDASAHGDAKDEGEGNKSSGLRGCLHGMGKRILAPFRWSNDHGSAPVLLAIGDGANDVAMLQAADVGVGLLGREGRQAANSADYVLSQFRHLVPLLLVHGTLCRYRLERLTTYSFYKNVAFFIILFVYQPFCGWSGQAVVDDISSALYNVVFTALPILIYALLDRPARDSVLLAHPTLYASSGRVVNLYSFWIEGIVLGVVHGAVCFFVPFLSLVPHGILPATTLAFFGKEVYIALLGAVTLELAATTRWWTIIYAIVLFGSWLAVYPTFAVIPYLETTPGIHYPDSNFVGVTPVPLFVSSHFWMSNICVYVLVLGARLMWLGASWLLFPSPIMQLERERAVERNRGSRVQSRKGSQA